MGGRPLDLILQRLVALLLVIAAMVSQGAGHAIGGGEPTTDPVAVQSAAVQPTVVQLAANGLPSGLTPSLAGATSDVPASYTDGCHAKSGQTQARVCTYGDTGASFKVLLFGDSHAGSWLPALDALGKQQHWRIMSLTKSACPIPTVTVTVSGKTPRDCDTWRTNALARIKGIRPDLVVATSFDHVYTIAGKTGSAFLKAWREGMTRTLRALKSRADRVILLGDSPLWKHKAPECLAHHQNNVGWCATKRSEAVFTGKIANNRRAARDAGVDFADTTSITCLGDPCPVVSGKYLMLRDDSHMTATWSRHLASRLLNLLGP